MADEEYGVGKVLPADYKIPAKAKQFLLKSSDRLTKAKGSRKPNIVKEKAETLLSDLNNPDKKD